MPIVSFPYNPEHLAFGDKPVWISDTDGDTPTLQLPIRMLGIDAPELHYQGASSTSPGKYDVPFGAFLTAAGKGPRCWTQTVSRKEVTQQCLHPTYRSWASSIRALPRYGSDTACAKGQERQTGRASAYFCHGRGRSV